MKNLVTVIILFLFTCTTAFTQVVVTPAINGEDLPRSESCGNGDPGGFVTLDDMIITEQKKNDFRSSCTLSLNAPTNWQFNTSSTPTATVENIGSLTPPGVIVSFTSITTNQITFSLIVNNKGKLERLIISNVQVQAIFCVEGFNYFGHITPYIEGIGGILINGLNQSVNMGTLSVDETSPLPVELTSFSAILKDKEVLLNWSTATEVNNYGFDVERMRDGEDWKALGFVEGNGNSNSAKEYSFVDNNVSNAGTYYYRLKQIDNDGAYEYSKSISVDFDGPAEFDLEQNYPNPFNPSTTIRFNLPDNGFVSLKIFNTLGEEVQALFEGNLSAGTYTYNFNAKGLPSGLYIYRLSANAYSKTKKMLFMK